MYTYQPTDERLKRARVALENARQDAVLAETLGRFGYDAERLNEGEGLLQTAQDTQETHAREYGDQYGATDVLKEAFERAHRTYMQHVRIARVALQEDRQTGVALDIDGRRKQTMGGWLKQARLFYDNALSIPQVEAALGRFGVTREDLEAGRALVEAVGSAEAMQEREKSEAQKATEQRDVAMDALDGWMSDFINIARVAFEDDPQQLEKLHVRMPSA